MGVNRLGAYGAYTAYPMFLGAMILTGNGVGALRGEWRGTTARTRALMLLAVIILALAFVVLARANQLLASAGSEAPRGTGAVPSDTQTSRKQ